MTEQEILTAAETLEARGERASIRKVRAELGGGDPNTIARVLKARRESMTPPEQPLTVPESVLRELIAWASQIASAGVADIHAELVRASEDNEALAAQVDDLQKRLGAAQAELEAVKNNALVVSGQLKSATDAARQMAQERDKARAEAEHSGKQLVVLETKLAVAEAIAAEVSALRAENKELLARAVTAEASLKAISSAKD